MVFNSYPALSLVMLTNLICGLPIEKISKDLAINATFTALSLFSDLVMTKT